MNDRKQKRERSGAPLLVALLVVLLAACTSATTPAAPAPPALTSVPAGALDSMCARIHDEGIARETMVDVVSTTRPLVTEHSVRALAEAAFYSGRIKRENVDAAFATNGNTLPIPSSTSCAWHSVDAAAPRSGDTMTLELSAPFVMPFGRGGPGLLARLSLGGESATWYWIPLKNQNGAWIAGTAMPLGMHE